MGSIEKPPPSATSSVVGDMVATERLGARQTRESLLHSQSQEKRGEAERNLSNQEAS
jgi:hypothetical protein